MLKDILSGAYSFAKRRFNELLSVIGLFATLYIGLLYVPGYVRDIELNKRRLVQEELVREIGHQIYAGETVDAADLFTAANAKRVYYGLDAAPSPKEILLLVQNDFERNEYVTLDEKRRIRTQIKGILSALPAPPPVTRSFLGSLSIWALISGVTTLLAAILGVVSLAYQAKREAELDTELEEIDESIGNKRTIEEAPQLAGSSIFRRYDDYKTLVIESLSEMGFVVRDESISPASMHLLARKDELELYVEPRAYLTKVGVGTIRGFLFGARQAAKLGVLVTTSPLTVRAKEALEKHRSVHGRESVFVVYGITKGEIVEGLASLLEKLSRGRW